MRNRWFDPIFAVVTLLTFSHLAHAQTIESSNTAKKQSVASAGDLSGVWANITVPRKVSNPVPSATFSPENPSLQPWAQAKWEANKNDNPGQEDTNGRVDRDPTVASCFPTGMPRLMTEVFPFEIIQIRSRVLILFEKDYAVSHIWTDGRKLPKDPDPSYMGSSIGRWEGDTLVVDTIGLKDITWLDRVGHPHSDALHIVARMRRVNHDRLQIDWTFDDPKAFTKPWTGRTIYRLHPDWRLEELISCEDRLLHGGESLEQKALKGDVK
jgi:hypothetical protein